MLRRDDVVQPKTVKKAHGIGGHVTDGVRRMAPHEDIGEVRWPDIVQMGRGANVAVVEPDDEMTALREGAAELVGPGDHLHGQAHDQDDRRLAWVTERLVGEFDVTRGQPALRAGGDVTHVCWCASLPGWPSRCAVGWCASPWRWPPPCPADCCAPDQGWPCLPSPPAG